MDGYERGFFVAVFNSVEAHQFNMGNAALAGTSDINGKRYVEYVMGSILDVPMVGTGIALDLVFNKAGMDPQFTCFLPKGLNAIVTALTAAILYLFAFRLYEDKRLAVAISFIYYLWACDVCHAVCFHRHGSCLSVHGIIRVLFYQALGGQRRQGCRFRSRRIRLRTRDWRQDLRLRNISVRRFLFAYAE